jgi:hypothetical protein
MCTKKPHGIDNVNSTFVQPVYLSEHTISRSVTAVNIPLSLYHKDNI